MGVTGRGGRVNAPVIPNIKKANLQGVLNEKGSLVSTDQLMSYGLLEGDEYKHVAVHHVNSVEGFWKFSRILLAARASRVEAVHGQLSERVHFPVEPSRDAKCDV
jgi:transposase